MSRNKRSSLFAILVSVLMVFTVMPIYTGAAYAAEAGWVDIGVFHCYIEPDQGTAVICGLAEGSEVAELTIPASIEYEGRTFTVTGIDLGAFYDNDQLTGVTVAYGIKEIPNNAFRNCTNLSQIVLPDTLEVIGLEAFSGTAYYNDDDNWKDGVLYIDSYLIKAKGDISGEYAVEEGTRLIADYAFYTCEGLTNVTIPSSVIAICDNAFADCRNLSQVDFGNNSRLITIGGCAFKNTGLTSIEIPASVRTIELEAFRYTGLTSVILPEGLEGISSYLFEGCGALTEVTIPSTVTYISSAAFSKTALTTIHFGGSPSQWAAITGYGKPSIEPADYGKEDATITLDLSVCKDGGWINGIYADSTDYITSALINGADTRSASSVVGGTATVTITPAEGYMVSGVKINNSTSPWTVVQDYDSRTDTATGVHTITFTPPEDTTYAFSVSLYEAVRVTFDLNGGMAGNDWGGDSRLISKGTNMFPMSFLFDGITPPDGKTLEAVEMRVDSGTYTIAAKDLSSTAQTFDSDVAFKCIWKNNAKKITPAVTLSASSYTYDGKVKKPAVTVKDGSTKLASSQYTVTYRNNKNVGKASATVTLKGNYSGSKTVTFKINPKGTSIKSLTKASKAVTVKWTKQATKMSASRITGYQIQLATDSKFTKNKKMVSVSGYSKVSKKATGLKGGKKYYVKIRTYKTVGGTKYYSPWSKVKTVTTKK